MEIQFSTLTLIITALTTLIVALAIHFVPAMIVKWRRIKALRKLCRGKLVLTYDDGPDPLLTPPLIDLLRRYGARASFFLVGFRAARSPTMCQMLLEAGHELGCHTNMHKRPWRAAPWTALRDMNEGYAAMWQWMPSSAPFRPPFGKLTTWTWLAAKRRRAELCFWTFDGCDTHPALPDPAVVAQRAVETGGAVVLLHSHDRGEDRQHYVLALTEQLLLAAKSREFQVCTMSELFQGSG